MEVQFWATYCKVIGYSWLVVTGLLIMVGIAGVWMKEGLSGVQDLLNSLNMVDYAAIAITLIPGIALLKLSGNLQRKVRTGD